MSSHSSSRSRSRSIVEIFSNPTNPVATEPEVPQIRYLNPGYLDSSSHTNLFYQLRKEYWEPVTPGSEETIQPASSSLDAIVDKNVVTVGTQLLKDLVHPANLMSYFEVAQSWIAKGSNVGLVESFTQMCIQNTRAVVSRVLESPEMAPRISKRLFTQSPLPMCLDTTTTLEDFCSGFNEERAWWETIGLCFTASCRAATDVALVIGVYDTQQDRQNMQVTAMRFSDRCLEISLTPCVYSC